MDKTNTPNWIDFREFRSRLSFARILDFYGVKGLSSRGDQQVGFCPIPTHKGTRNTPSFSAHLQKGIFQCFGCGAKGNLLDFAILMEGGNPERGLDVRKTALKLRQQMGVEESTPRPCVRQEHPDPEQAVQNVVVNEPLGFRLRDLDPSHPYLFDRNFTSETISSFGLGYCSRGILAGRVAIPLYDSEDNLIGYAGRIVSDCEISADNPKYLFPSKRTLEGRSLEFRKSAFLYNGSKFKEPVESLIVVEGFPSVWWLTQNDHPNVVAIMGSSCSDEQRELIVKMTECFARVWIFMDGDKAGNRCAIELCGSLCRERFVRMVGSPDKQPTDYSPEELHRLLPT